MKCILYFLICFITLGVPRVTCSAIGTEDGDWVTVEGYCSLDNITKEEARRRAIDDALRRAVEQAVGTKVLSETLFVNFRLAGDFIKTIPYGKVVEKEVISERVEQLGDGKTTRLGLMYCVNLKAKVRKERGDSDPYFKLEGGLNRSVFNHKDKLIVKVTPTRDAYITIFNVLDDDKVCLLHPTQLTVENRQKGGTTLVFPSEESLHSPISLMVELPDGKDHVSEAIYVLATKQPVAFDPARFKEGICTLYDGKTGFVTDLMREIVEMPLSERAERFFPYEIIKQ